jgi:hypothetical protein
VPFEQDTVISDMQQPEDCARAVVERRSVDEPHQASS